MNSPLVAPMSRCVVPFSFSPSSSVMVYVAFLVHQKVGWVNAALTFVARLGSRLPNAIVPPVRNLQVPITVAETETLVLLAAFADPTHAARNTAAITAVTLFIPIFLLAIFLSNSPYRHRHPIFQTGNERCNDWAKNPHYCNQRKNICFLFIMRWSNKRFSVKVVTFCWG